MATLSKLEYLKKHMEPQKKQKRKKIPVAKSSFRIHDDDIGWGDIDKDEDDASEQAIEMVEELPTIAAVIDERPKEVRDTEVYRESHHWRAVGSTNQGTCPEILHGKKRLGEKLKHQTKHSATNKHSHSRKIDNSGQSTNRKRRDSDQSSPRKRRDSDQSPPRKSHDSEQSPARRSTHGQLLKDEHTATVVRDRQTGKKVNIADKLSEKKAEEAKQKAREEKVSRWGKGVAQEEQIAANVQSALVEMGKPLARLAGDSDLERLLKDTVRADDPMQAYISKKKKGAEESQIGGKKVPSYKGPYPPNRFNIPPGYRWDGVDRSNGFESKYFLTQNNRKAMSEVAYKWSTEDL